MKQLASGFAIVLIALACSACTDETGDEADGHLLETQQQALERARGVEQDVAEAARQRAEQIDDSGKDG